MAAAREFTAGDIYVIGNPILSDCSFLKVNMDDIKNIEENLRHHSGEEQNDGGYYIYEMGEAMSYVTRSTMDGSLCAVILTTDQFQLGCRLKVGMKEEEITSLGLPFVKCSKEEYPTDSAFVRDISSPFNTLDYDAIYLYRSDSIPEDAVNEKSTITKGRIDIAALVKDGEVIRVFVDALETMNPMQDGEMQSDLH